MLIFPVGCRTLLFKQVGGFLGTARKVMGRQGAYFRSLGDLKKVGSAGVHMGGTQETQALKGAVHELKMQFGVIRDDMTFAKREMASGKLTSGDSSEIARLLPGTMVPAIGISTIVELFETVGHRTRRQHGNDGASRASDAIGAEIDEKGMERRRGRRCRCCSRGLLRRWLTSWTMVWNMLGLARIDAETEEEERGEEQGRSGNERGC